MGYVLSNSGTPSVSNGCKDDVSSVTDHSTGNSSINFYDSYQRTPIVVAAAAGGTGAIAGVVSSSTTAARILTSDSAGSATDMAAHILALGWDSPETQDIGATRNIVRAGRLRPVLLNFNFNAAGTLFQGKSLASLSSSTSTYTFTLNNPFACAPVVIPTCIGSTAKVARVTSASGVQIVIDTFDAAGSGSTSACNVLVLGWYSAEFARSRRVELLTPQRKPRLTGFEITVTTGTPALTSGTSLDGSIVDNGTGDFTITLAKPFTVAPEVVASADGSNIVTVSSTTSAITIKAFNNAGSAADPGKVSIIALGRDYLDEH